MNNVQLKVNVINQLQLLRRSTFKDKLCFIDENIQNAQRAKATEVRITTKNDCLIIENNGQLLHDPQKLFSLADTGWDAEVVENENPFGLGFFSNISVSNMVEVHSGNLWIKFDVDKMINSGDVNIPVEYHDDFYDGFKITLHNFNYNEIHRWDIAERVKLLGRYVHELDIIYNEELQEKRDLLKTDGSTFAKIIDEPAIKGWIALDRNFSSNLNVFYKGRLVTKISDLWYLKGDVHINDAALNLSAPDRKDIIRDQKYSAFKTMIREVAGDICLEAILNGAQSDVDRYAEAIRQYCEVDKVKDHMKFMVFRGSDKERIKYLHSVIRAKQLDNRCMDFSQMEAYLAKEAAEELPTGDIEFTKEPDMKAHKPKRYFGHEASLRYIPIIDEDEKEEAAGNVIFELDRPKFWVNYDDITKYEDQVEIIKHYDLYLIMARNKFEVDVLNRLEEEGTVIHISKLEEKIALKVTLSNTKLSVNEQRAMMLFEMISRMAGYQHNVFAIGDLKVNRVLEIDNLSIRDEKEEKDVVAIYNKEADKIYVDRSAIKQGKLIYSTNPKLCISDYKFIMANISLIAHEISMMKSGVSYEEALNGLLKTLAEV